MNNALINMVPGMHRDMLTNKIMLVYEGEFSQDITKAVLAMTERNLDIMGEDQNTKRKVFNVMVECLQNICKHTEHTEDIFKNAIFIIGQDDTSYFVISGNVILNENTEMLRSKLLEINSLDKDGLKMLYKEIVTKGQISEKGGAGLGLVDIARKSGQKLEFEFSKWNESTSFYTLLIRIPKAKEE